ncbi:MAG: gamma-glutamyl-gamma-aminobutyrate hydrolase family protein [Bdellovibrionia bacterium]
MRFVFLFIVCVFTLTAHAEMEGVVVWQPHANGVKFILPKIRNMALSQFVRRYTKAIKSSPVYSSMEGTKELGFPVQGGSFKKLPDSTAEHPNVAVVLNRPAQMADGPTFLAMAAGVFEKEGPRLYAIPIGLETVLSDQDMKAFRSWLNTMDGQLGMGGDDVHPAMYGRNEVGRALGDLSMERDQEIIAYFREYLKNGKGRVFYICGALQRAAVMEGAELHDDIAHLTEDEHRFLNGKFSTVEVIAEEGSELAAAAGARRFKTTNAHHAAVNSDSAYSSEIQPRFKVTGYNIEPNGARGRIVKSIDFPGNAGFATQFHPEVGTFPEERRIIQYVATGWKLRARVAPHVILECLENSLLRSLGIRRSTE